MSTEENSCSGKVKEESPTNTKASPPASETSSEPASPAVSKDKGTLSSISFTVF